MWWCLFLVLPLIVSSCDIKAEVETEIAKPIFAQFTFHNGTRSQLYKLQPKQKPFHIRISGALCNLKPTTLKTWKEKPANADVPPLGMTFAFIEGVGDLGYTVYGEIGPRMTYRAGVGCGFGDCGGHGK